MEADDIIDGRCVSAAHADGDRDPPGSAAVEHDPIACPHPRPGQRQGAQPIALPGIDAGLKHDDIRYDLAEAKVERVLQRLQIRRIAGPGGKRNVQVARRLSERVVVPTMERQGEHARIVRENRRRPITLVHITVHDQRFADPPRLLEDPERNGGVVKNAVSPPLSGVGMVGATGEVDPATEPQGGPRGGQGAPNTATLAGDHLL